MVSSYLASWLVMKTLAVLAQKDGSGKTTIVVHMAACAELGEISAPLSSTSTHSEARNVGMRAARRIARLTRSQLMWGNSLLFSGELRPAASNW